MKRALSLLLALLMAASLVMPQAWATGLQEPEPDAVVQQTQPDTAEPDARQPQAEVQSGNAAGLTPITRTKNAVASGVTLEKVVMRNVNGSQVVGYLSEIDLSKDVTLKASYTGYYYDGSTAAQRKAMVDSGKLKWEMSQTTAQAAAYGRASDTEGRVVLATNADYYNMQTGAPTGYLRRRALLRHPEGRLRRHSPRRQRHLRRGGGRFRPLYAGGKRPDRPRPGPGRPHAPQ